MKGVPSNTRNGATFRNKVTGKQEKGKGNSKTKNETTSGAQRACVIVVSVDNGKELTGIHFNIHETIRAKIYWTRLCRLLYIYKGWGDHRANEGPHKDRAKGIPWGSSLDCRVNSRWLHGDSLSHQGNVELVQGG